MKYLILFLLYTVINAQQVDGDKHYNILTLDGGGIRGLIPGQIIWEIERDAFEYAKRKGWADRLPRYEGREKDGVVHMKDLFDMTAGTSTGSILAGALALPKNRTQAGRDQPKFFADDGITIYTTEGGRIFAAQDMPWG